MSRLPSCCVDLCAWLALLTSFLVITGCGFRETSYRYDSSRAAHLEFSGENAYRHVEVQVGFGPRPSGSQAQKKTATYLEEQLAQFGWRTQRQEFTDPTPLGPIAFTNIRARFPDSEHADPWKEPVRVIVGSHYDTKYFRDLYFVGANDGGSTTGILLEMARVIAARPALAQQLELVFFDGEEAIENYTATDGLYGSKHYVETIIRPQSKRNRPSAVVILDLLGEKSLNVEIPSDTPPKLRVALFSAARELGHASLFGVSPNPITDDHSPFQSEGVPSIDIIDLDYSAWHTSRDTLSQISQESLAISGKIALLLIEKYLLSP